MGVLLMELLHHTYMNSLTFTILLVPVFVQIKLFLFNLNHLGHGVTVLSLWQPLAYGTIFPISFAVVCQLSHSNPYPRNISSNLLIWTGLICIFVCYIFFMLFVVLDCTSVDCISSLFPFSCWYILFALYAPPGGHSLKICDGYVPPHWPHFQTACHWMTPFLFFTFCSHLMTPFSKCSLT